MSWIDLTQTIHSSMPGVSLIQAKRLEEDGWNAKNLNIYTHAGTHMDAPIHFGMPGPTIDKIPLEQLIGYGRVVDLEGIGPKALIMPEDLGKVYSEVNPGECLILKTGWSKYANSDPDKYREELPRISEKLAEWIVKKKIKIVAVEPPSVADVNNLEEVTKIHRILFAGQVIIVEGICNLDAIKGDIVELMVFPLRILDGDGAPARVVAKIL
jgi:arylformamidase